MASKRKTKGRKLDVLQSIYLFKKLDSVLIANPNKIIFDTKKLHKNPLGNKMLGRKDFLTKQGVNFEYR